MPITSAVFLPCVNRPQSPIATATPQSSSGCCLVAFHALSFTLCTVPARCLSFVYDDVFLPIASLVTKVVIRCFNSFRYCFSFFSLQWICRRSSLPISSFTSHSLFSPSDILMTHGTFLPHTTQDDLINEAMTVFTAFSSECDMEAICLCMLMVDNGYEVDQEILKVPYLQGILRKNHMLEQNQISLESESFHADDAIGRLNELSTMLQNHGHALVTFILEGRGNLHAFIIDAIADDFSRVQIRDPSHTRPITVKREALLPHLARSTSYVNFLPAPPIEESRM